MYPNHPQMKEVRVSQGSTPSEMRFDIEEPRHEVPVAMDDFIRKLGWISNGSDPDTMETLYHKPPPSDLEGEALQKYNPDLRYNYWRWYEAVAYEFTKFISIGEDAGPGHGMGKAEAMGRAAQAGMSP